MTDAVVTIGLMTFGPILGASLLTWAVDAFRAEYRVQQRIRRRR